MFDEMLAPQIELISKLCFMRGYRLLYYFVQSMMQDSFICDCCNNGYWLKAWLCVVLAAVHVVWIFFRLLMW